MSPNTYAGPGLLSARGAGTSAMTFTLSGAGLQWSGAVSPIGDGAVFPAWLREGRVVSLRLDGGGTGQAQVSYVSLDRRQPVPLHGIGPWPG